MKGKTARVDYTPGEIARMPQGWMLWLAFLCHATAGLMVIGYLSPFAQQKGMTAAAAAGVVGYGAIFNGLGRIVAGWVSDKLGRRNAMLLFFGATAILMFLTPAAAGATIGLLAAVTVIYGAYGSNFSLFPSTTADFFGTKNVGGNYGLIFTSWGFAGVAAGRIGAQVYSATGAYDYGFYISGVLAIVAVALMFILKAPEAEEERAPAQAWRRLTGLRLPRPESPGCTQSAAYLPDSGAAHSIASPSAGDRETVSPSPAPRRRRRVSRRKRDRDFCHRPSRFLHPLFAGLHIL